MPGQLEHAQDCLFLEMRPRGVDTTSFPGSFISRGREMKEPGNEVGVANALSPLSGFSISFRFIFSCHPLLAYHLPPPSSFQEKPLGSCLILLPLPSPISSYNACGITEERTILGISPFGHRDWTLSRFFPLFPGNFCSVFWVLSAKPWENEEWSSSPRN